MNEKFELSKKDEEKEPVDYVLPEETDSLFLDAAVFDAAIQSTKITGSRATKATAKVLEEQRKTVSDKSGFPSLPQS